MPSLNKISKNNTVVYTDRETGGKQVVLHQTCIVQWNPEARTVKLHTGGWYTVTTRTRMSQAMNEWSLPVRVGFSQKTGRTAETYHPGTGETVKVFPFDNTDTALVTY